MCVCTAHTVDRSLSEGINLACMIHRESLDFFLYYEGH